MKKRKLLKKPNHKKSLAQLQRMLKSLAAAPTTLLPLKMKAEKTPSNPRNYKLSSTAKVQTSNGPS